MKWILSIALSILVLGIGAPNASALPMPTKKFSSCKALNKVYPNGVTFSAAAARRAESEGWQKPKVNAAVFRANLRLDQDGDGVVCPREAEYEGGEELSDWFDEALCKRLAITYTREQMPAYCAPFGY